MPEFCASCGKALRAGARFCTSCGEAVDSSQTPSGRDTSRIDSGRVSDGPQYDRTNAKAGATPASSTLRSTRRKPWPWLIATAAVVIVIGVVALTIRGGLLFGVSPSSTTASSVAPPTATATAESGGVTQTSIGAVTTASAPRAAPGTVLYEADWSQGMDGWVGPGDWKLLGGMLLNDGTGDYSEFFPLIAPVDLAGTADYAVEAEIRVVEEASSFGIVVRADNRGGGYVAGVGRGWNRTSAISDLDGWWGTNDLNGRLVDGAIFDPRGDWHSYRVEVRGNTLRLFVDDAKLAEVMDNKYLEAGRVGLWSCKYQLEVRSCKVTSLSAAAATAPSVASTPTTKEGQPVDVELVLEVASSSCWLVVRENDEAGVEVYAGTLSAGARKVFKCSGCYWMMVGKPSALTVHVNGTAYRLDGTAGAFVVTKDGVEHEPRPKTE